MRQKLNQSVIHGEAWVSAVEPKYSYDEDVSEDTDLLKERTLLLNVYVRTVQANLASSKFGRDLDYAIADAESEQDSHLKQNPPQGISNAFLLRDYLIAMAKRRRVIELLEEVDCGFHRDGNFAIVATYRRRETDEKLQFRLMRISFVGLWGVFVAPLSAASKRALASFCAVTFRVFSHA